MESLLDKVALITGAARGQGEAIARRFVAEGARVVLADILDSEGKRVAEELGPQAQYVRLDVTSPEEWSAAVASTEELFGQLDVLVNNAGILTYAPLETLKLEDYMRTISVNQIGCLLGMQAALPLLKRHGGSIINSSSIAGLRGVTGLAAYSSSKWAVRGLTRTAAAELGEHGIRVNSIHPGAIATAMLMGESPRTAESDARYAGVPLGRIGEVEDIANLVTFLASDASSFCTGSEFTIDGGRLAAIRSH